MKILKKAFYPITVLVMVSFLYACNGNASKTKEQDTQASIDSLKKEKRELTLRLEKQKQKIDNRIEELKEEKAEAQEKKTAEFYDQSIERLNKTSDSLQVKMDRFNNESKKDWKELKKEMNEAFDSAEREWEDVKTAVEDFFRKDK